MTEPSPAVSLADRLARMLPAHRVLFAILMSVLTALNLWSGPPWWTFWPMLAAAVPFTLHTMIAKAVTADERWADRRADEISDRSYDLAHTTSIVERYTRPRRPPTKHVPDGEAPGGGTTGC